MFKAFEPFERYGFNKAHATCYGLIAYQTAYMKANHTVEYMTAVLTAFRSNEEKVAAAVAECRRMGIEVLPPDVHRSHLEFTVEGDAIRFGLLAVKNVGQGAIESIIAARDEGGPFRSLTDFCTRIDLRLANRKVLEALAKVGALSPFGHPAQILLGLDDAIAAAQATQRDRISGQTSLFDLGAADAAAFERPLPAATEVPVRERLRWEKELLGLYLSEHPMGEVAEQVGRFVTAYSSDLRDESLDGQRIVVGGIVTGVRTVITKAKATMAIVTLEDLQGTIEVVVFPRLYEQTTVDLARRRDPARRRPRRPQGRGGLAAGRPRRRLGRGGGRRRGGLRPAGRRRRARWGRPARTGGERQRQRQRNGQRRARPTGDPSSRSGRGRRPPVPVGAGAPAGSARRRSRSSRRGAAAAASRAVPARPRRAAGDRAGRAGLDLPGDAGVAIGPDQDDEPPVPDEARARIVADATADAPIDAGPGTVLHVRFAGNAAPDRVVGAMEAFKAVMRDRPGATRVVIHVPATGGGRRSDGAAPRRRLRRRAAGRGQAAARRRPGRPSPRSDGPGRRVARRRRLIRRTWPGPPRAARGSRRGCC